MCKPAAVLRAGPYQQLSNRSVAGPTCSHAKKSKDKG